MKRFISLIAIIICFFTFFQITANAHSTINKLSILEKAENKREDHEEGRRQNEKINSQYEVITNSEGKIEHIKENYTDGVVEFKLNIELDVERNTGIGNDFRAKYYVNNKEVSDGDILLLDTSENVELSYDVYEEDEHPDEGSGYDKVHIYSYKETAIRVHAELEEYMGRKNQGAEATIGAIFTFTPLIEEQTIIDKQSNETTINTSIKSEEQESKALNIFQIILIIAVAGTLFCFFVSEFLLPSIKLYRKNKRHIQIYGKQLKKRCVDCEFCNWYWYHPFYKHGKYRNLMKQKMPKYCKKIRKQLNNEHDLRCIINDLDFAEFEEKN